MKLSILLLILLSLSPLLLPGEPYKPIAACQPDQNKAYYCRCLIYHPKEEFCEDETAPLPSCCLAGEKDSKVHVCGCCRSVYGSKRNIDASKVGTYLHVQPIVEYAQ